MAASADDPNRRTGPDRLELLSTVLLAVAAVATAWSSYQATRWNGEQATAASRTNGIRIEAARVASRGEAETEVDVATFIAWVDAARGDDPELAEFYQARFRPEFRDAFDAWIATDPIEDPTAPPTPFAMPEYDVAAEAEADRLDAAAEASAAEVRLYIQRAGNYVLAVVLYAVALFFGGLSTKLESRRLRRVIIAFGYTILVGAIAWIATFPVTFDL